MLISEAGVCARVADQLFNKTIGRCLVCCFRHTIARRVSSLAQTVQLQVQREVVAVGRILGSVGRSHQHDARPPVGDVVQPNMQTFGSRNAHRGGEQHTGFRLRCGAFSYIYEGGDKVLYIQISGCFESCSF